MKTYCTFAVASLMLATATGAMAAHTNAESDHSDHHASTLTTEAVIADLVASRKAAPTQSPHDGEWYNVPAPLGGMTPKTRHEGTASTQAMPEKPADLELSHK